jgi:hypothetical protein
MSSGRWFGRFIGSATSSSSRRYLLAAARVDAILPPTPIYSTTAAIFEGGHGVLRLECLQRGPQFSSQGHFSFPARLMPRREKHLLPRTSTLSIASASLGNIGQFHFNSAITGETHRLSADAKVSATVFSYKGQMRSTGSVPAARRRAALHVI